MTPKQFDALLKRHRSFVESSEFMFAQLTSWVANTGFRTTEKPTTWTDFAPSQWQKKAKEKASYSRKAVRMTKTKRKQLSQSMNAALMTLIGKR